MPENPENRRFMMMGFSIGLAIGLPIICVMSTFFGQRAGELTVGVFVVLGLATGAFLVLRRRI